MNKKCINFYLLIIGLIASLALLGSFAVIDTLTQTSGIVDTLLTKLLIVMIGLIAGRALKRRVANAYIVAIIGLFFTTRTFGLMQLSYVLHASIPIILIALLSASIFYLVDRLLSRTQLSRTSLIIGVILTYLVWAFAWSVLILFLSRVIATHILVY